jgi:hypothetical protein
MEKKFCYFYGDNTVKKGDGFRGFCEEFYTVIKAEVFNNEIWEAEERAEVIAKQNGFKLAGGMFTSNALPYNFKTHYTVIYCPKNTKVEKKTGFSLIDFIMAYESGEASQEYLLEGFANLIKTGQAWSLQGHYGRTAQSLIDGGYISREGEILQYVEE